MGHIGCSLLNETNRFNFYRIQEKPHLQEFFSFVGSFSEQVWSLSMRNSYEM